MDLVNLTPHALNIIDTDGSTIATIPPSGTVARCAVTRKQVSAVNGIPINRTVFGAVDGLPGPQTGKMFIVSALVAQAVPTRIDVLITDDAVRDADGRIIGCRALASL